MLRRSYLFLIITISSFSLTGCGTPQEELDKQFLEITNPEIVSNAPVASITATAHNVCDSLEKEIDPADLRLDTEISISDWMGISNSILARERNEIQHLGHKFISDAISIYCPNQELPTETEMGYFSADDVAEASEQLAFAETLIDLGMGYQDPEETSHYAYQICEASREANDQKAINKAAELIRAYNGREETPTLNAVLNSANENFCKDITIKTVN